MHKSQLEAQLRVIDPMVQVETTETGNSPEHYIAYFSIPATDGFAINSDEAWRAEYGNPDTDNEVETIDITPNWEVVSAHLTEQVERLNVAITALTNKNNELELALEAEQAKSESLGAVVRAADESLAAWSTKVDKARKLMQTAIDNGEFDDEIEEIWLEQLAQILDLDLKKTEEFSIDLTIRVTIDGTMPKGHKLSAKDFEIGRLDIEAADEEVIEIETSYSEDIELA